MRKSFFYSIGWVTIALSLPLLGLAVIFHQLDKSNLRKNKLHTKLADIYMAWQARCFLLLSGSTVSITGLEHIPVSDPVVFISNHQGHFDSAVLLGYVKKEKSFIATSVASKVPILSTWFNYANTIYMEKDNMRQNYQAITYAEQLVNQGRSVVVYPEGIISSNPQMGEFKRGGFKIAFNTGVPIVPVVIDGTWQVMGSKVDKIQPAQIEMKVLPPIETKNLSKDAQKALPSKVFNIISETLATMQQN